MGHILVVDDEPMMRHMVAAVLRHGGHTVEDAADGREAAEKIQKGKFDLVITDINMPERNGLETLINLRSEQHALPVIAMSGMESASPFYLNIAESLGARRTLQKPFSSAQLLSATNEVLAEARSSAAPDEVRNFAPSRRPPR
jgi:CheY-like chemotaxis protein